MDYNFGDIEAKWQQYWRENQTYKVTEDGSKPKYYVLDMFPYPSGAGLHVGHPLGYIATDIVSRYKRHQGFNVLHPMGYDSFGLPAEQYAIQTGQHPAKTTAENIEKYRSQLDKMGFCFDWSREVRTSSPEYYKWTQWIFTKLFNSWYNFDKNKAQSIDTLVEVLEKEGFKGQEHRYLTGDHEFDLDGFSAEDWKNKTEVEKEAFLQYFRLAYLSEAYVNWCPALGTVLANEEVQNGVSERGGHPVERKLMKQWSLRITAYADRLLNDLDTVDWSPSLKDSQRNWIGKSVGAEVKFSLDGHDEKIPVFTTRPDTIFGVSFMVLAPEHELVAHITTAEQRNEVEAYQDYTAKRSERERMAEVKKITGAFTGAYAIHPFTGNKIPVWIGDYVLAGYGTGAVMAVPSGDERDHNFATHFGIDIPAILENTDTSKEAIADKAIPLCNSDFLNGLCGEEAIKLAVQKIEENGFGKGKINFRLRDAIFGRQRYWGEPIPVYFENGIPKTFKDEHLPLQLPEVDKFLPTEDGEPPLARASDWKYSPESGVGKEGFDIETTTMPGWAGSSWYYLRYMDPNNASAFADKQKLDYWQQIDLYMGGAEHATGHLLYFRFWTKFLKDLGYLAVDEPAKKLVNQGMIQGISEFAYRYGWNSSTFSTKGFWPGLNSIELIDGTQIEFPVNSEMLFFSADIIHLIPEELVVRFHTDINYCDSSTLDIKLYLEGDLFPYYDRVKPVSETKNFIFLCRDGYYINDTFYPLEQPILAPENGNSVGVFTTKPEVEKMSKSKKNVINPDDICNQYGADTLRLYEMFLGPIEQHKPWNTNGISGVFGFFRKFWKLFHATGEFGVTDEAPTAEELKIVHKTIKKVTEDIERFSFNTVVSAMMICTNELNDLKCNKKAALEPLVVLLAPFAPHIAEELWNKLGHATSVVDATWPIHDEKHLIDSSHKYPISFNGKTRFMLDLPLDMNKEQIEKTVLADENTAKYLDGKSPKKVIVVPKKIVNVVV